MSLLYIAPTPELAVELSEVRADAAALAEVFSQLNAPLPDDFPKSAVIELATALYELPNGTAKGCLRPLNEAQAQLATIRSQYIRHDDHNDAWEVDRPPLFRGEPVDQRLRSLMSSVSTALQTANRLAAEEPEPEMPEAGVRPPKDSSTAQLLAQSSNAQIELDGEREELGALKLNSEPADTLSRRLTDASILNHLTRGELRLPRIVSARLRRISSAMREYPALLQKAAELVSSSTHIADYVHEKWNALETRIFQAGTSTIREIADDISNFAKKLDANRKASDNFHQGKPPADFDLEEAVRLIHGGIAPPPQWRPFIENLPLGNRKLKSLSPLTGLTNLKYLTRVSVKVRDIAPVADLIGLVLLNLDYTQISDLGPLEGLERLQSLSLRHTQVSDLSPLSNLSSLDDLDVARTAISDLTPLRKLIALVALDLSANAISDLAPLSQLANLRSLYLSATKVTDLAPLSKLTSLESLYLHGAPVSDLTPLRELLKLKTLGLGNTRVTDLTPLAGHSCLENLNLDSTNVSDLSALSGLSSMEYLKLEGTKVTDLRSLKNLSNLKSLDLDDTLVSDVAPIAELSNLHSLHLSRTQVEDLTPLSKLHALRYLNITGAKIIDLRPLLSLPNLNHLSISKDKKSIVPSALRRRGLSISYRK